MELSEVPLKDVAFVFGWDRAHFPHSSLYGALFYISAENSIDNIEMVSLLLSSTCTASRDFLFLTLPHQ